MNDWFRYFFGENGVSNLYLWSVPIHIVLIVTEIIYSNFKKYSWYETRDTATTVFFSLCNFGLDLLLKVFSFYILFLFFDYRFITWENGVWYWILLFFAQDLAYYVLHFVDHHSRIFWAIHVTHHNSEYFNLTTGFRSSVFQPLYRFVYFIPLVLLGFNPLHILSVYAIVQIYGTWIHTQSIAKLGFLEKFMVTPSHHRVHHASNQLYLDRNMGQGFIIWDKIFGTFQHEENPEQYEKIKFGLTAPIEDKNPMKLIFTELVNIYKDATQKNISFSDRLKYIFYPPGWSHVDASKMSVHLRKEAKNKVKK